MKEELRQACIRQGWTMEDIAKSLSISVSYLYKLLEGKRGSRERLKEIKELIEEEEKLSELPYTSHQVKMYCYKHGMSLKDFASSIDISLPYLYDIMNGRRKSEKAEKRIREGMSEG